MEIGTNCILPQRVLIAPDGKTVYYSDYVHQATVVAVFLYAWPIWGGLILGSLMLLILMRWGNLKHEKDVVVGQPFCRKCGYQLTGSSMDSCPECGRDLNACAIKIARPIYVRGAINVVMLIIICGVLIAFWESPLPRLQKRQGQQRAIRYQFSPDPLARRYTWRSHALHWLLTQQNIEYPQTFEDTTGYIWQMNLETGKTVGPITKLDTAQTIPMMITPDRRYLVMTSLTSARIFDRQKHQEGRLVRWPEIVLPFKRGQYGILPAGLHDNNRILHYGIRWDLQSGKASKVEQTPSPVWPIQLSDGTVRYLRYDVAPTSYAINVTDENNQVLGKVVVKQISSIALSPDGTHLYVAGIGGAHRLTVYQTSDGQQIKSIKMHHALVAADMTLDRTGRFLFAHMVDVDKAQAFNLIRRGRPGIAPGVFMPYYWDAMQKIHVWTPSCNDGLAN